MKRSFTALALIAALLLMPGVESALAQSARDLNTEGYRLYLKGKFPEALSLFRRAVTTDPAYALARYNLACTLGVLRKQGPEAICRYDAYKSAILDQLEEAARLDPATREKIRTDPDLDTVRDTVRYLRMIGYSPTNEQDIEPILVSVSWFGPASGAFGPASKIDFLEDGTVSLSVLDTTTDVVGHSEFRGTFSAISNRIRIMLDRPLDGITTLEGTMLPGGTLDIPGLPGPFTDDPHECEA
jgi:tetratricopeptide (TPR) repeat protein